MNGAECPEHGKSHLLREMHHVGKDGRHWCPTGYLICDCGFTAKADPSLAVCTLVGQRPPHMTYGTTCRSIQVTL